MVEVYVDGSFTKKNPNVVGWGYHSSRGQMHGSLEGEICSMHQVGGELKATIEAIKDFSNSGEQSITILHDYLGVSEWANGNWKAKNKHTRMYVEFIKKARSRGITINFVKIDASANPADELARRATGAAYAH